SATVLALVRDSRPAAAWHTELPATPDFDLHTTWIVPPIDHLGAYVIVASSREDFAGDQGSLAAVRLVLSDLILVAEGSGGEETEVVALSGATGELVAGAELRVYMRNGTLMATGATGADGIHRFLLKPGEIREVVGDSKGGRARLDTYANSPDPPDGVSTLLYTDRAVYRPGQTIFWKVLAYEGSRRE